MGTATSFLENLEWRRAEKHFGGGSVDTTAVLHAIIQSPSSFGLQPYKIVVVKDKQIKETLKAASFGQAQVSECDTLLIFCARSDITERMEEYLTATGNESMRDMLTGFVSRLADPLGWATRQVYIALGFGLAAAAEQRIASCPMEGFMPEKVKTILSLPDNLVPCVLLALGEKSEQEQGLPRFRFPETDLILRIGSQEQTQEEEQDKEEEQEKEQEKEQEEDKEPIQEVNKEE